MRLGPGQPGQPIGDEDYHAFGNSEEFDRRFGGLDNLALVTNIYWQVLGRGPDPEGLAFYVGELDAERMTLIWRSARGLGAR